MAVTAGPGTLGTGRLPPAQGRLQRPVGGLHMPEQGPTSRGNQIWLEAVRQGAGPWPRQPGAPRGDAAWLERRVSWYGTHAQASGCSRYHATVRARPSARLTCGDQPRAARVRASANAYRRSCPCRSCRGANRGAEPTASDTADAISRFVRCCCPAKCHVAPGIQRWSAATTPREKSDEQPVTHRGPVPVDGHRYASDGGERPAGHCLLRDAVAGRSCWCTEQSRPAVHGCAATHEPGPQRQPCWPRRDSRVARARLLRTTSRPRPPRTPRPSRCAPPARFPPGWPLRVPPACRRCSCEGSPRVPGGTGRHGSAAACTTASQFRMAASTTDASQTSPTTSSQSRPSMLPATTCVGEFVEDHDLAARRNEVTHHLGPHEAGPSGQQHPTHSTPAAPWPGVQHARRPHGGRRPRGYRGAVPRQTGPPLVLSEAFSPHHKGPWPQRVAVISVPTLQGASLVVLSALAAAWVWRAADTRAAIVRAPRRAIEAVRAESYTIVVAPYAYLQTRDRQHLDEMQQAVADVPARRSRTSGSWCRGPQTPSIRRPAR